MLPIGCPVLSPSRPGTPRVHISLVPAPANADTRILSYKSADTNPAEPHPAFIRQEAQLREHKLLSGFLAPTCGSRPVERDPIEREEKRQMRELRLEPTGSGSKSRSGSTLT